MSNSRSGKTVRLTVAQAVVTYLSKQYSMADGQRRRLVPATLGIFGHGNVAGMGQALDQLSDLMPFVQGRNEQSLVHLGVGYAKAMKRHATLAVTASIGPGALNLITGAGLATVNRLPVLLLPGDTYATRRQGPVLQQLQHPVEADATVNDAFRPVSRFFDRINRPEQLLTALPAAMRVLTDPVETGAVVLSLPQDIQSHACDFPAELFAERDWLIRRPIPDPDEVDAVARLLAQAQKPVIIAGGGVVYSDATAELEDLASSAGIPVLETMAGKGAVQQRAWWQLGGIGLEGTPANNDLVREADLVLTVGSRLTDFPTASQSLFENPDVRFAAINVNPHDAHRLGATRIVADAKRALGALADAVTGAGISSPAEWQGRGPAEGGEGGGGRESGRRWPGGSRCAPPLSTRTSGSTSRRCRRITTSCRTQGRSSPRRRSSGCCRNTHSRATPSWRLPGGRLEICRRSGTPRGAGIVTWSSGSPAWATRSRPAWASGSPNRTRTSASWCSSATAPS